MRGRSDRLGPHLPGRPVCTLALSGRRGSVEKLADLNRTGEGKKTPSVKRMAAPPKDVSTGTLSFSHFLLGDIYQRQSKKDLARPEYQEALRINPKNEQAKKALETLK